MLAYLHREWLKRVVHNTASGSGTLKQYVIVSTTAFVTSRPRAISFHISVSRIVRRTPHIFMSEFFFKCAMYATSVTFSLYYCLHELFLRSSMIVRKVKSKQSVNYRIWSSLSVFSSAKLHIFVQFYIFNYLTIVQFFVRIFLQFVIKSHCQLHSFKINRIFY